MCRCWADSKKTRSDLTRSKAEPIIRAVPPLVPLGRSAIAALFLLTTFWVAPAFAQLAASGQTLTVNTANAVATFKGPDLVGLVNAITGEPYLELPSNGLLADVNAFIFQNGSLQASDWSIGSEPGTGL